MARIEKCISSWYPLVELVQAEGPSYLRKDWAEASGLCSSTVARFLDKKTRYITWRTLYQMATAAGVDIEFAKHKQLQIRKNLKVRKKGNGRPKLKLRKAS